ncbi:hypothetical protein GQ54DRAFT_298123 [Martensiomyces pterosporus]|nr:hypothetical protein GQ54DRAFT_298123 [Martensiomyces pterosporus]
MASAQKYTPPESFKAQAGSGVLGFDRSAVDNKELWLLRIPDNIPTKHLEGLKIKHPRNAHNGILSEMAVGDTTYQIVSSKAHASAEFKGMEEMSVLVPDDDEDSALTLLPNQCAQLLSVVEKIDIPESFDAAQELANREHPVRPQPEGMKLQFLPYGFYSAEEYTAMNGSPAEKIFMADDTTASANTVPSSAAQPAKKRKKDGETKAKKAKDSKETGDTATSEETKKEKKEKKDKKGKKEKAKKEKSSKSSK